MRHRLRLHCMPLRTLPQQYRSQGTSPPCHTRRLLRYRHCSKPLGPPRQSTTHECLERTHASHGAQSRTTLLWQSLKVSSLMISHFFSAQALQYGFESHGKLCVTVSEHSWLVFQLFPNSRAVEATKECLVVKSSLRSPLLFPQRPHTLFCVGVRGKNHHTRSHDHSIWFIWARHLHSRNAEIECMTVNKYNTVNYGHKNMIISIHTFDKTQHPLVTFCSCYNK